MKVFEMEKVIKCGEFVKEDLFRWLWMKVKFVYDIN